jgi:hypothetical protein
MLHEKVNDQEHQQEGRQHEVDGSSLEQALTQGSLVTQEVLWQQTQTQQRQRRQQQQLRGLSMPGHSD